VGVPGDVPPRCFLRHDLGAGAASRAATDERSCWGVRWIVDGMNLIGSKPDGWWRDRAGAQRRLVSDLAQIVRLDGDEVAVVFDGKARPPAVVTGVSVTYAPGGPNAADRAIAAMVRALSDPVATTVVTSDGDLVREVRSAGAGVLGVTAFRRLLERPGA
jgi:predicted RNA-binding protein with PIN domain